MDTFEAIHITNPLLPEPILLQTDPELVTALAEEETTSYDRSVLKYFKADTKLMSVLTTLAASLGQTADWVLDKFVKGLIIEDTIARKVFLDTRLTAVEFGAKWSQYLDRYRVSAETNYIPSCIVSAIYTAMIRVLNFSEEYAVPNDVLTLILPVTDEVPDAEER